MNIIGKHYDGLVVEDTKGIFGGQHCILEISAVKSRAFNGLVVRADGCEYEKTPFGTSVGMELLGNNVIDQDTMIGEIDEIFGQL